MSRELQTVIEGRRWVINTTKNPLLSGENRAEIIKMLQALSIATLEIKFMQALSDVTLETMWFPQVVVMARKHNSLETFMHEITLAFIIGFILCYALLLGVVYMCGTGKNKIANLSFFPA